LAGNHQAQWVEIRTSTPEGLNVAVPNATRNSETKSAIRSWERFQKMSAPTASHTNWKTVAMATFRAA
jgi:hypothetical protein